MISSLTALQPPLQLQPGQPFPSPHSIHTLSLTQPLPYIDPPRTQTQTKPAPQPPPSSKPCFLISHLFVLPYIHILISQPHFSNSLPFFFFLLIVLYQNHIYIVSVGFLSHPFHSLTRHIINLYLYLYRLFLEFMVA